MEHTETPCPACNSAAPGQHFSLRVGTEIPSRFTRCPFDTEEG